MKKSVLSVFMTAAIIAFSSLIINSCGGNDNGKDKSGAQLPDSTKLEHDGFATNCNFRYVDIDTLMAHYQYAIDEMHRMEDKSLELQKYQNQLAANLSKKQNDIQTKYQNQIYLSQQSYEADVRELQTQADQADKNYGQRAQALSVEMAQVQEKILNTIENYIIRYNQEKKYDAILLRNAGLYFNPELDITNEILTGLNSEYAPATTATTQAN